MLEFEKRILLPFNTKHHCNIIDSNIYLNGGRLHFCKYIIAALGAAASIFTSILLLHNTKETQLSFRSTYEALKREQVFYLNQVGDYAEKEPEKRGIQFINNCEKLMMNEQKTWIVQRQDKN